MHAPSTRQGSDEPPPFVDCEDEPEAAYPAAVSSWARLMAVRQTLYPTFPAESFWARLMQHRRRIAAKSMSGVHSACSSCLDIMPSYIVHQQVPHIDVILPIPR